MTFPGTPRRIGIGGASDLDNEPTTDAVRPRHGAGRRSRRPETPPAEYVIPLPTYGDGTRESSTPGYTSEPSRRHPSFAQRPTWFREFVVIEDLNAEEHLTSMSSILADQDMTSSEYHQCVDVSGPELPISST